MERLNTYSSNALVYVLVHKMDKIKSDEKKNVMHLLILPHINSISIVRKPGLFQKTNPFEFLALPFGMRLFILYNCDWVRELGLVQCNSESCSGFPAPARAAEFPREIHRV